MARHGPMVLGVCRKLLRDPNDVDDAFQATFLVLVRKAATLRRCDLLGNWLYGVAMRVAMRAPQPGRKTNGSIRLSRMRSKSWPPPKTSHVRLTARPRSMEPEPAPWLHQEVSHLPEKYRTPVVLCYFEGLTHDEAASRMGCPLGTVKGRLSRRATCSAALDPPRRGSFRRCAGLGARGTSCPGGRTRCAGDGHDARARPGADLKRGCVARLGLVHFHTRHRTSRGSSTHHDLESSQDHCRSDSARRHARDRSRHRGNTTRRRLGAEARHRSSARRRRAGGTRSGTAADTRCQIRDLNFPRRELSNPPPRIKRLI